MPTNFYREKNTATGVDDLFNANTGDYISATEFSKGGFQEVKKPTVQPEATPPNVLNPDVLNDGMTKNVNIPSNAADEAEKVYNQNMLSDGTKQSEDLQKQMDNIKANQLKEAQVNQENANKQVETYNNAVNPVIENYNQDLTNKREAFNQIYTQDTYLQMFQTQKDIVDETNELRKIYDKKMNSRGMTGVLASVVEGRKSVAVDEINGKITLNNATMNYLNNQVSLGSTMLKTGIDDLNDFYDKQINYQKTVNEIFKTDEVKTLTNQAITDLQTKKDNLDKNKETILNLMSTNPIIAKKAELNITDTPEQITTKLVNFYNKNPQYTEENQAWIKTAMNKYYDAGITMNDPIETVKSKILNSRTYEKETTDQGKYTMTTDPLTGEPVVFNTKTGTVSNGSGDPMRTDRNNNPTAMTTDVAKTLGLVQGVDYVQGDKFPGASNLYTAKLLGDPIDTTIKALDTAANDKTKKAFYTQAGQPRWTYIAMTDEQWSKLTPEQKKAVVAKMYQNEGGNGSLLKESNNSQISESAKNWATLINTGKAKINEVPEKQRTAVIAALANNGSVSKADAETTSKLQDKISQIDDLISKVSTTGSGVIGPTWLARWSTGNTLSGKEQEFVGSVKQLISKETLDTLVNLKKAGGTLGALSDQERVMLQNAATKIGNWEKKDKNGNGKGVWAVSESAFKTELETIKKLTQRALENAGGNTGVINALEQNLASNPQKIDEYNILVANNPNLTDDDINQLLGFDNQ